MVQIILHESVSPAVWVLPPQLVSLLWDHYGSSGRRAMRAEGPDEASDHEEQPPALGEVVHS